MKLMGMFLAIFMGAQFPVQGGKPGKDKYGDYAGFDCQS